MPTPTKKRSYSLPHSGKRVWKPSQAQIGALAALSGERKAIHFMRVAKAYNVLAGLALHGYVELTEGIEGSLAKITPAGRALLAAVRRDPSLIRTEPKR